MSTTPPMADRLSDSPSKRLEQLFSSLFDPEIEKQWLHYAVHLLTSLSRFVVVLFFEVVCVLCVCVCVCVSSTRRPPLHGVFPVGFATPCRVPPPSQTHMSICSFSNQHFCRVLVVARRLSADYYRPLYGRPLNERFAFESYAIDACWGSSMAMQPLFSAGSQVSPSLKICDSSEPLQFSSMLDFGISFGNCAKVLDVAC